MYQTMENNEYGSIKILGTDKEIPIKNWVKALFTDNRVISILEIDGGDFIIDVQNPEHSERAKQVNMRLSKESFIGLFSALAIYYRCKGYNEKDLIESCKEQGIEYYFSGNLKTFNLDGN